MNNIDLEKVKAAVKKYAPGRVNIRPAHIQLDPVDAGRRKPLNAKAVSCRPGFNHPHFLHGIYD